MKSEKISTDGCALNLSYFHPFSFKFGFWKKDKNTWLTRNKLKLHITDLLLHFVHFIKRMYELFGQICLVKIFSLINNFHIIQNI